MPRIGPFRAKSLSPQAGEASARRLVTAAARNSRSVRLPASAPTGFSGATARPGTFSKSFFPALRLGFIVAPAGLHDQLAAARRASDMHPPMLDQIALADFMAAGHFERHLRRMRRAYTERLAALVDAVDRWCDGALRVRPVTAGLHAVADVQDLDARMVCGLARDRGVEVMPLSAYFLERSRGADGLVLGFGSNRPDALAKGMEKLAEACDVARRRQRKRVG